ncbi:MAG: hypothetical protein U0572_00725 [Phycisphaerales bacterium]
MRRLARSLLFPILIVGVALILTWNARQTPTSHATPVDVEAFVRSAMSGGEFGSTDPILVARLQRAWPKGDVRIEIESGDGGPGADGTATHRATITAPDGSRIVVRCRYDDAPSDRRFVGYWTP